jgi:uncharacterized protein
VNEPQTIRTILEGTRTIAVVGLSASPARPSHSVSAYMQRQGYRIIPVNPGIPSALGERSYPNLETASAMEGHLDLVNVFRAPAFVPEIVKETMRLRIPFLWLQEGVCHEEAAQWAENDGIKVVMDRCILKEHSQLAIQTLRRKTGS